MVSPEHENATIEAGMARPATSQREQVLECCFKSWHFELDSCEEEMSGGRSWSDAHQAVRSSYQKGRDTPS